MSTNTRLQDKTAVITGAASGIGWAIAELFAREGARVALTDIDADAAAARAAELPGGPHLGLALDVSNEAGWERTLDAVIAKLGGLDIVVNNAGIPAQGGIEDTTLEHWRRVMAINLDGTFLGCKHMFGLLRKKGGSIVNLSSVLGMVGSANLAAYSASKGGVSLLSKSVALHGARYKPAVRCNAICPAFVDGPMVDDIAHGTRDAAAVKQKLTFDIPLGRLGQPVEVASLCVYLLSDASAFITGADLPIDGGLTAR